jgi:hypothetical protein
MGWLWTFLIPSSFGTLTGDYRVAKSAFDEAVKYARADHTVAAKDKIAGRQQENTMYPNSHFEHSNDKDDGFGSRAKKVKESESRARREARSPAQIRASFAFKGTSVPVRMSRSPKRLSIPPK